MPLRAVAFDLDCTLTDSASGICTTVATVLGVARRRWRAHWRAAYGAAVLTKADYDPLADPTDRRRARRAFNGRRQAIGPVAGLLLDRFGLAFPRARSHWGAWTRLAAKVAAFNLAVYFNYLFRCPPFALFDPLT